MRTRVAPEVSPQVESVELTDLAPLPTARTRGWRQQAAEMAVRWAVALLTSGRHLLLAGDPVAAIEIVAAPSASQLDAVSVCLLDASAEEQAARLTARGDDPTLLVHHQAFAEWMRRQASDPMHMPHVVSDQGWEQMRCERLEQLADRWRMHTIDTSHLSREEVAAEVLEWCRRALAGDAPALQVNSA